MTTAARMIIGGLAAWNVIINRLLPPRSYVPANLAAAGAVTAAAAATGVPLEAMGLGRDRIGSGIRWGAAAAAALAAGSWAGSRIPLTRALFDDARVDPGDLAFQGIVRIPLGTAVLEELAFRGALPAILDGPGRRVPSRPAAALFGLWHVIPTINTLDINGVTAVAVRRRAVVSGVAVTAVAGLGFDLLRLRSGSVLAPMLAHWAANAVSYAIAARRSGRRAPPQAEAP